MAVEQLFASFKEGGPSDAYDPGDPDTYEQFIQAMISDSRDYEDSVLAPRRDEAQKYYYGYVPSLNPDGSPYTDTLIIEDPNATYEQILGYDQESAHKSTYVSTDVRDAVMLIAAEPDPPVRRVRKRRRARPRAPKPTSTPPSSRPTTSITSSGRTTRAS